MINIFSLSSPLLLKLPGLADSLHLGLCLKCCLNPEGVVNLLSQLSHRNGFRPECILLWFSKLRSDLNLFPQLLQGKGVSPVCVRIWIVRSVWPLYLKLRYKCSLIRLIQCFLTLRDIECRPTMVCCCCEVWDGLSSAAWSWKLFHTLSRWKVVFPCADSCEQSSEISAQTLCYIQSIDVAFGWCATSYASQALLWRRNTFHIEGRREFSSFHQDQHARLPCAVSHAPSARTSSGI